MNGLFYCDWFEQYTADLTLAVATAGHRVTLVVREQANEFTRRPDDGVALRTHLRNNIADLEILPGRYWSPRSFLHVWRIAKQADADYFHIQQTGDPRFLCVAALLPTVLTLHEPSFRQGNYRTNGFGPMVKNRIQWLYRRLARVIVVHTETSLQDLSARERYKAVVIPHGVNVSSGEHHPQSKTVLFFGRNDGYKGLSTLVSAMEKVWRVEPQAVLQILASPGSCQPLDTADARIQATWNGFSDQQLQAALTQARVVCLPYTSASGSGVGAQAYGAGKTVIASDLDGLRELVNHPELLVEPGSSDDLARALVQAFQRDYGIQPVDSARAWPEIARRHISQYEAVSRTAKGRDT